MIIVIILGVIVVFIILLVVLYNTLVSKKNQVSNVFASIDAAAMLRYLLSPFIIQL